jgi:phosphoribosylaminoimidazole-succinocarboxamide synthase
MSFTIVSAGSAPEQQSEDPVTDTSFPDLKLVSRGKVRDVYATSDPDVLLFVATDRISAFDIVLKNVGL